MRSPLRNGLIRSPSTEDGQALAEFTLILAFVAIICIVALVILGEKILDFLNDFLAAL